MCIRDRITTVAGEVVSTRVVDVQLVQASVPEVIHRGTRLKSGMIGRLGTGSFLWPVPGYSGISRWASLPYGPVSYTHLDVYKRQPFVHTCGSRYVDRTEDVTEVRIYSNLPEVSLYKDGHLVETKKGDKVFVFNVPITGKHSIEARAGAYSSVILVNKAAEMCIRDRHRTARECSSARRGSRPP